MAWLVALAIVATVAVTAYAAVTLFVVILDRRRRGRRGSKGRHLSLVPDHEPDGSTDSAEIDFVQMWLDDRWEQRSG